ncbi:MAG: class II aldolase/adducin family protein [Clostridiales bacterium]|nr:class II aldolase/adducin family protein [Clostridiales bacterium]
MRFTYMHPADQLVEIMTRIYRYGMTTTSGGNLSIMDRDGDIWITPSGIDKGSLTRDDMMQVKPDGTIIGRHRPSVELPFHREIYRRRSDLKAIVHAHPPTLVAYSLARVNPDLMLVPEDSARCGRVVMAKYAVPGSQTLGDYIADCFSEGYDTVMLENHGVVCGGSDLLTTFDRFETIEFAARTGLNAKRLGGARRLTEAQCAAALETRPVGTLAPCAPSSEECALRRDLARMARRCYNQKLFSSTQGTWSARLSDGAFLITPEDVDRHELTDGDIVRVEGGACEAGKTPARTWETHAAIYRAHPEVASVIEAHPPATGGFAVTDARFDSRTIPESYLVLRDVAKLPFEADAEAIARAVCRTSPVLLIQNRGAVVTGVSLINAFDKLEVLDYSAQAILMAQDVGPIVFISPAEVREIEDAFHMND